MLKQDSPTESVNTVTGISVGWHLDGDNAPHTLYLFDFVDKRCKRIGKEVFLVGRTSLEKEIARNRNITVRLTETEYDIVRNDAASAGLSISNYCRKQILKGAVPVQYSIKASMDELTSISKQMSGIGNNLNQIAKYYHTGGAQAELMQMEISKAQRELNEIRLILEKIARKDYGSSKT